MISEHTVKIDDNFYERHLKPYRGCPKGAEGMPGQKGVEGEGMPGNSLIKEWLSSQRKNIISGTDEDFVCIPKMLYEILIR